jgi:glycosyltransferase involved in cell wall biosynthesis
MPKLLHLISNRWHSAITEYAISAAESLSTIGVESIFIAQKDTVALTAIAARRYSVSGVRSFEFTNWLELRKAIPKTDKSTPIICYGGAELAFAQLHFPNRKILRFRGEYPRGLSAKSATIRALSTMGVEATIYPSRFLKTFCQDYSHKSHVIEIGRDEKYFRPHANQDALSKERPSLLILGRFDPVKGHQKFFEILSLAKRQPEFSQHNPILKIVGEPKNVSSENLRSMAASLTLTEGQDYEIIDRRVEDVGELIRRATIGVVPSTNSELICRVSHEFSLSGVPIFVSGVGSLNEALFEGAGASYRGLNADDTAALLVQLIDNTARESRETKTTRAELAASRFSHQAMGKALVDVLRF